METEEDIYRSVVKPDYFNYPGETADGARRWIEDGIWPGHFLSSVIRNDLKEAVGRADLDNQRLLRNIVVWWYNEAPGACWGSDEKASVWNLHKGLRGRDAWLAERKRFLEGEMK